MDQKKHWNTIASSYEEEIFDVFKNDRNKILQLYFSKHNTKKHTAIDFGCGVGKAFPFLAPVFKHVLAVDISEGCLAIARETGYTNISFQQLDLSKPGLNLPAADFAFCCNVIMLPEVEKNSIMLRNIQESLKEGGKALIVIPSFESIFYASWRLIQLYKKDGIAVSDIHEDEFHYFKADTPDIVQGIMHINGVPTKHYSQPEIEVIFKDAGLTVTAIEKIEYDWHTEFAAAPSWMKDPYPWDWLVECRK
jgi:SAM-dependent methyltransferase